MGAELYDRYLDEWLIAEDEGLDIMLNEHHQTATCVDPAAPLVLGALARMTKKARLLILGNPIANRRQPVRVAEEMAMIDVLSRGRLEVGLRARRAVRNLPANSNPVRMNERQWEALDLIVKAWTTHDGPFSFEGRFFHHRAGQHLAAAVSAAASADLDQHDQPRRRRAGRRHGLRAGDVPHRLRRHAQRSSTPIAAAGARRAAATMCRSTGWPTRRWSTSRRTKPKRAPAPKSCCGTSPSNKVPPHFANPPGYVPVAGRRARCCAAPNTRSARSAARATVEGAIEAGIMIAGTPDQVYRQIKKLYDHVGGFGHLLIMGQAGFLEHDETVLGIRIFAREVYPRLKEEFPDTAISGVA